MRSARLLRGLIAGLIVVSMTAAAQARHRHRHPVTAGVAPHEIPPSDDAIQLAGIAPPARDSTIEQSYGDAAFARARMQSRYPAEETADAREAAAAGVPYPCDPRVATAAAYVCRNDPAVRGYGQGYAFTPSYVSSPNVFMQDPSEQTPVMPAITGFFWAVNSARVDPH